MNHLLAGAGIADHFMLINFLKRLFHSRGAALDAGYYLDLAETELAAKRSAAAATHYEQAWARLGKHDSRRAHTALRMARSLKFDDELDAAEIWFQRVLDIEPGNTDALELLAFLHYNQSRPALAQLAMQRRIAAKPAPGLELRKALMGLPAICDSVDEIGEVRARYDLALDDLLDAKPAPMIDPVVEVGLTPFYLAYYGIEDRALMKKLAGVIRKNYSGAAVIPDFRGRFRRRKRRVAFVSTNFNTHSIGRTTIGWIRDLPRDDFEVWVFSIAPRAADPLAEDIRRAADVYVVLSTNMDSIRAEIAAGEPDFLIFADLGMHPLTYYLAFWRLAPVQLLAWGHPVSMGIDSVDHFISADMLEPPGGEQQYSENLLRLSRYFMPRYTRPSQTPEPIDRESLGLPRNANLYGCPQTMFKLHPDFDEVFASILDRDPAARIVLIEARKPWANKFLRRIERRIGAQTDRLLMLPQRPAPEFHKLLSCMDVLLDPFYFGGNNSSAEGLALGVPVITLPAPQLRGRFTLGHYREMEFDGCIAKSAEQFIEITLSLGTDAEARRAASERILASCGRLFDRPDAGVALGEALQALCPQAGNG